MLQNFGLPAYFAILCESGGEGAKFSMMFEGFNRFLPAALATLIATIPFLILTLSTYIIGFNQERLLNNSDDMEISTSLITSSALLTLLPIFFAVLVSSVIGFLLFFALPLIADRNLGFTDAAKLSVGAATGNVGGVIVLFILQTLVLLVGLLVFCVGFLFVLPVIYASNIVAYRNVFPQEQPSLFNEPPRPDAYGGNYGTPT